ncbi:glutaredoxin domain-containing protein [Desertibaculum subflavum]|uniref:glutaredoxin domain-containing protein n=1 Tax=Desertibaculum subflavum TaxID=2268458 RepID=UPI0013C48AFE
MPARRLLLAAMLLIATVMGGAAQPRDPAGPVDIYVFWSRACPHCERALDFLGRLKEEQAALRLHTFEVDEDDDGAALFRRVNEKLGVAAPAVPMIIVGDAVLIGYGSDDTTGRSIAAHVRACRGRACVDIVQPLIEPQRRKPGPRIERPPIPKTIRLPLVGEIETAGLSLPLLTVAMGAVDGFNPCAMWGLVFLIGLLIGMTDRRRAWLLGSVFVAVSALVYFAMMAAWLNLLLLLGALLWIRVGVGVVALAGGAYYLREFARGDPSCRVTAPATRRRLIDRVKEVTQQRQLGLALVAVAVLAVAVNLIDLLCSAGLPAVYTEVLAQSRLPLWQYYAYLALYIIVFMADDLVIFASAMTTLSLSTASIGYTRYASLVGGVVLLGIGVLLLFRPEWLAFQ